jgi:hypothetical protein
MNETICQGRCLDLWQRAGKNCTPKKEVFSSMAQRGLAVDGGVGVIYHPVRGLGPTLPGDSPTNLDNYYEVAFGIPIASIRCAVSKWQSVNASVFI